LELPFDAKEVRLRVGLEVHQQLASHTKLFCSCPIVKTDEFPYSFSRRLRPAQSELGRVDSAVSFEFETGKQSVYRWNPESSCLVDADEEPPHELNSDARETALVVATMLHAALVDEIHIMRKLVIDGSNTSGFQRTAVVALGGSMEAGGVRVGVQTVTLEEDAARILGEDDSSRYFALDRLGVPLVEIALETVTGPPELVEAVALSLGRALRATGRVERGLGTIRQDLNVSVMGGGVVEVKGVQKLNLIQKVVVYEATRQMSLSRIAQELAKRGVMAAECTRKDVSGLARSFSAKTIREQLDGGGKVLCISAKGFAGLLGMEPYPGFRLGRELAEVARAYSLGGIIHSDEFARQGITPEEGRSLGAELRSDERDALILVAGPASAVDAVAPRLIARLESAVKGVPPETRSATPDGETRYMRPRPGAQRMYPETDVPETVLDADTREAVKRMLPSPWEETVASLRSKYSLSEDVALRIFDSGLSDDFEATCERYHKTAPSVVAWAMLELPSHLARELRVNEDDALSASLAVLEEVDRGGVTREAAFDVAKALATGKERTVSDAVRSLGLGPISEDELREIVDGVVRKEGELIAAKGDSAFSPLMGEVMKLARGRADGKTVSRLLRDRLAKK